MPKPIEYTKSEGRRYVPATSRYVSTPIIMYEGKLTFPIYKKKQVHFNPKDQHYEITKDVEYRPDLVSNMFFGAPDFWWRIMEMNKMKDVLEFREGRNIILPGSSLLI
jgi:hypothetical protein